MGFFKNTKMLQEAKQYGKKRSSFAELFSFLGIMILSGYLHLFVFAIGIFYYFCSDSAFVDLFVNFTNNVEPLQKRALELISISPEWLDIYFLFSSAVSIFFVLFFCKKFDKRPISSLGIRRGGIFKELLCGAALGLVLISLVYAVGLLLKVYTFNGFGKISLPVFLTYMLGAAVAAFASEVAERGYLFSALSKNYGIISAVIYTCFVSVLFNTVGIKVTPLYILNSFIYSLFAVLYVIKRGNIWGVSAFKFVWSFCQLVIFGLNSSGVLQSSSVFNISIVNGFDTLTGGAQGTEGSLISILALFIGIGLILKMKQNEREIAEENETEGENENEKEID